MLSNPAPRLRWAIDNLLSAKKHVFCTFKSKMDQKYIHIAKQKNLDDVILHVDFEKAFDSISFNV